MAAELPIPIYTSLDQLYSDLGDAANHAVRWNALVEEFEARFGRKPAYIARAPGRVNLIGEHIDYALFGVLPAAVERDILIACAPRAGGADLDGGVRAQNVAAQYTPAEFAPARGAQDGQWFLAIDPKALRWESYVKAGYYGVLNTFFDDPAEGVPVPIDILVTGTVPAGSGLSSSAAMVVASTLAFLAANDRLAGMTKGRLVGMAVQNEIRVGVNSGGMDQAASVISTPASALHVSFYPRLHAAPTTLPTTRARASFVLANSRVTSQKAAHARTRYNLRVVETRAAARVLIHKLGLPLKAEDERPTLREVVGRLGSEPDEGWAPEDKSVLRAALRKALEVVDVLKPEGEHTGVTVETMAEWAGMDVGAFRRLFVDWIDVEATYFELYKRTRHVFEEALRVLAFRDACATFAASPSPSPAESEAVLKELGRLMDASMESCSTLYECSCPELDELTAIARRAGAYGSRLTGAGWGGCTVSLVAEAAVPAFIETLQREYAPYAGLEGAALAEVVFATKPSAGACGE
ncbi:galactokinase gal [Vararia minispora EC-137]|uniref:Galactokinase gal n=1 Tax=Vararia minispora EC-137 TaxID=1314806 RepID=A0ACB8Q702_9AGAM|nr:galactokinase gal [Vararia minispora EC-137]